MRLCAIRFAVTPAAEARDRFGAILSARTPAPVLVWKGTTLTIEYAFPEIVFSDIWQALGAAELRLEGVERLRSRCRALLEDNEREFLRAPLGWRPRVDRFYLACAAVPAARPERRGALWRKHERHG